MAKIVIDTELNTKQFDKQMEKVQKDLVELKYEYDAIKTSKPFDGQNEMLIDYQNKIEKATNSLIKLKEQQNKLALSNVKNVGYNLTPSLASGFSLSRQTLTGKAMGDLTEKTEYVADSVKDLKNAFDIAGESGERAGVRAGQGFEKGIKSLKRFSLALFGVRSVFMLVRRATSTYLSQNETTADKINAIWVALGNALAPIIEMIADGVIKLIGYLNVFLQALGFNVDLTKNMNKSKRAIDGTTKSMKELNKQMYSFDEINSQQKESATNGESLENTFKMPKLNQDIVNFLQDTAKRLKENWELLALIGGVIATYKVANWLGGLGKIIGTPTTGLMGVSRILKPLATIGVIAVGVNLIYDTVTGRNLIQDLTDIKDGLEKMPKVNTDLEKSSQKLTKDLKEVFQEQGKANIGYEKGSKEIETYIGHLKNQIDTSKRIINAQEKEQKSNNILEATVKGLTGTTQRANIVEDQNIQRIIDATIEMGKYASQGKLTEDQLNSYADAVDYLKDKEIDLKDKLKETHANMFIPYDVKKQQMDYYQDMIKQIDNIKTQTKNKFSDINSIIAKPKVEVQTNIDKAKQVLEALSKSSIFSGIATTTINALKRIGLAKGGIYNNPGKGVSMSNVVVGEATNGAEGVVPLNNEQSMDLIGQSIAKHVVINLTSTTLLDNKVISRQQSKITDATNFATNGRGV